MEVRRHGNITAKVIKGFHEMLRGTVKDFVTITKIVHDPDMGFSPILKSEMVTNDFIAQNAGRPDWLAIVWNRDMLRPCAEQGRQFQGVKSMVNKAPEAILYRVRYVDLTINNMFVAPTMDVIEYLEETFLCFFPSGPFDFSIERTPNLNILASVKTFDTTGVSRLGYENYGSVSILSTTANIVYPLILEHDRQKLIAITDMQVKV